MANDKTRAPRILLNMAVGELNGREIEYLNSEYARRVSASGAVPVLCPSIERPEIVESLLDVADGVIFIGGKDYDPRSYGEAPRPETAMTRKRPEFDLLFARAALRRDLPILGICAGCQLLNIVTGGKLVQHLGNAEKHTKGVFHAATVTEPGFFSRAAGAEPGAQVTVNSFHHQAVDPEHLGTGIVVTAVAFDGTVEAIEMPGARMVLGVQFHPERMDDLGPGIFSLLAAEARKGMAAR